MTNDHTSLEKYLSHLRKGCEMSSDWSNCDILTPSSFVFSSTSFSFWGAAQSGALRAHSHLLGAGSLYSILYPTNWLQLTELPFAPGYIIVWLPPAFYERRICTQFNPSTVKVIPWYHWSDAPFPWSTAGSKFSMLHSVFYVGLPCYQWKKIFYNSIHYLSIYLCPCVCGWQYIPTQPEGWSPLWRN